MAEPDPIRDFFVDLFGNDKKTPAAASDDPVSRPFRPVFPFIAAAAAIAYFAPELGKRLPAENFAQITTFLDRLHGFAPALIALAVIAAVVDVGRFYSHRHRVTLAAHVRQTTGHAALAVRVPVLSGRTAVKSARVKLPVGAVIRPKQMDEFKSAVSNSASGSKWTMNVSHEAQKNRLVITRELTVPDSRSARHQTLAQALEGGTILKDAAVSVYSSDDNGVETGYRVGFTPNLSSGSEAFQYRVNEALIAIAGEHESKQNWAVTWAPAEKELLLTLKAPIEERIPHPAPNKLTAIESRHLPYATGAAGVMAYWNVSTKSNTPHCLIVGPTGGGKTSAIRTILTEASLRGIPFIGVDPKKIELDGLEGYPGCGAIIYDPIRAAMFIRALHAEMTARNEYVHVKKIETSQLPLLIAVLDEFFILSAAWTRLKKDPDEETRNLITMLDPLGAWAELAVLARSAGIRLLLGVQRPDASLFGGASGNARDNFGTRLSLANLSQDGAQMVWGDAHQGRNIDTSIPGRAMATGPDGTPMEVQVWWTPNVDRHPNKWNQLSADDIAIVEAVKPPEAPEFMCYSRELREFLETERVLAAKKREHGSVAEPVRLGDSPAADIADAIPAHALTPGTEIVIVDDNGDLNLVTVASVDTKPTGTTITIDTGGRTRAKVTFAPGEIVMLADVDGDAATAA
jgi:hypothetical protein